MTLYRSKSPPPPSGPRYSARIALNCQPGHPPGPVLHALQELRSDIDARVGQKLGAGYEVHRTQSIGTQKITVEFALRAGTTPEAIRIAGLAAATLIELLCENELALDLEGVALVVRARTASSARSAPDGAAARHDAARVSRR